MTVANEPGLAGLLEPGGGFSQVLSVWKWAVPGPLELKGESLCWPRGYLDGARGATSRLARSPQDLALQFAVLWQASDATLHRFARRFGPLWLCAEHGLPFAHRWDLLQSATTRFRAGKADETFRSALCMPQADGDDPSLFTEQIADWRRLSREVYSMLRIASAVHQSKPADLEDWDVFSAYFPPIWRNRKLRRRFRDHTQIARLVEAWLSLGLVRLRFRWDKPGLTSLELGFGGDIPWLWGGSVFGAIAAQLPGLLSKGGGVFLCSGCGRPYLPERRPNANRRSYCPPCRADGAPQRDAARDYRRRRGS